MFMCLYANAHRDTSKYPEPFKVQDFVLRFDHDAPPGANGAMAQTPSQMIALLDGFLGKEFQ